jgi:hypothetical protein
LQHAVAKVKDGVRDDSAHLRHIHHAGTEHVAIEVYRPTGVPDDEKRGQAGRTMGRAVGGVLAVGGSDELAHGPGR